MVACGHGMNEKNFLTISPRARPCITHLQPRPLPLCPLHLPCGSLVLYLRGCNLRFGCLWSKCPHELSGYINLYRQGTPGPPTDPFFARARGEGEGGGGINGGGGPGGGREGGGRSNGGGGLIRWKMEVENRALTRKMKAMNEELELLRPTIASQTETQPATSANQTQKPPPT